MSLKEKEKKTDTCVFSVEYLGLRKNETNNNQKKTTTKTAESFKSNLQVFKVFYVAWSYQLSDVDCDVYKADKGRNESATPCRPLPFLWNPLSRGSVFPT